MLEDLTWREIGDDDDLLTDKLLGLIVLGNAANLPFLAA